MQFLKQFLKQPGKTGAIAPSSDALADVMTNTIDLHNKKCIIELGPGTGVFTKKIIEKKSPESLFFGLEINKDLANQTREECTTALIYTASADDIHHYLAKHGKTTCDCIISGLPRTIFDQAQQTSLIKKIHTSLEDGGSFLTFMYIQSRALPSGADFRELIENTFSSVQRSDIVWDNVPPAIVYHCKK